MKANTQFSIFVIAATYIGTVVGAGFASGQEVLQFFGYFGRWGLVGLVITTGLLSFFGYMVLELGRRLKAESHLPVIRYAGGRWVGLLVDGIITFFLLGALVTMGAGAGAIFSQQLGIPFIWGSLIMIAASVGTVLLGINSVVKSISFVVPFLLIAVVGVAAYTVFTDFDALSTILGTYSDPARAPVPFWPLTAILYTSYNLVLSVAILAPLGALSSARRLKFGAILGGLGLGMGAILINLAILTHIRTASTVEIPMITIAGTISPIVEIAYTIILLTEVYTTAVGSLYGFVARLSKLSSSRYRYLTVSSGILAFVLSQFGFSNLVSTLFPAVGFAGLLLLGSLVFAFIKDRPGKLVIPDRINVQPSPSMVFEIAKELDPSPEPK